MTPIWTPNIYPVTPWQVTVTSASSKGGVSGNDLDIDKQTLKRIRERVLAAEKEKLNLDNPRGIINDVEEIIRAEIK